MKIFSTYIKHSVATIKKKQKAITSWRLDLCSTREHKFKGVSKDNLGLLQMWLWDRNCTFALHCSHNLTEKRVLLEY